MATPGRPLDECTRRQIVRAAQVSGIKPAAKMFGVSKNTVKKYVRHAPIPK